MYLTVPVQLYILIYWFSMIHQYIKKGLIFYILVSHSYIDKRYQWCFVSLHRQYASSFPSQCKALPNLNKCITNVSEALPKTKKDRNHHKSSNVHFFCVIANQSRQRAKHSPSSSRFDRSARSPVSCPCKYSTYSCKYSQYICKCSKCPCNYSIYHCKCSKYPRKFSKYPWKSSNYPWKFSKYPCNFFEYPCNGKTFRKPRWDFLPYAIHQSSEIAN